LSGGTGYLQHNSLKYQNENAKIMLRTYVSHYDLKQLRADALQRGVASDTTVEGAKCLAKGKSQKCVFWKKKEEGTKVLRSTLPFLLPFSSKTHTFEKCSEPLPGVTKFQTLFWNRRTVYAPVPALWLELRSVFDAPVG
jgi:hypothetical protein